MTLAGLRQSSSDPAHEDETTCASSVAANAAIELASINKRFGSAQALSDCSLIVRSGEFVSLLGPSGCGKTTLLRIIAGFARQDSGTVCIQGACVDGNPPNKRKVNTVFQQYALFPNRNVLENVLFPLEVAKVGKQERLERAQEMLAMVHLDGFEKRRTSELSGGQSQRVALARALVGRPQVLLLDEPLAALDLKLRKAMQSELRRIHDSLGTTFIYVTHDQGEAMAMSDRIVLMNKGRILQEADPKSIYDHPATTFASDFLGEANLIDVTVKEIRGDSMLVMIGDSTVAATPVGMDFRAGGKAVLSIRPERIRVHLLPAGGVSSDDAMSGVLRRSVFLGHVLRLEVETPSGAMVVVEAPRGSADQYQVGDAVVVTWDPDAALALPPSPEGGGRK
jgi:ABC-type Fe3+/spermidine/putrescine transport system ATPase subunit